MSNPVLMVSYSDDHGRTWSAEQHIDLGARGAEQFYRRVVLHQQGSAMNRIYRTRFSEPRGFSIIEANAEVRFEV